MATVAYRRLAVLDVASGGPATISGTVKVLTTPVARPVYLFLQEGLVLRRVTMSSVGGAFSFPNVAAGREWLALSIDTEGAYNAVTADRVPT